MQVLYLGDRGDWFFFQHALVSSAEGYVVRTALTQTLPVAALLNDHRKRQFCINELLASVPGLLDEDVNLLRLNISADCFDASNSSLDMTLVDGLWNAPLGGDLVARLDDHMQHYYPDLGLQGRDIAVRAEFTGTCTGCHYMTDSPFSNPGTFPTSRVTTCRPARAPALMPRAAVTRARRC